MRSSAARSLAPCAALVLGVAVGGCGERRPNAPPTLLPGAQGVRSTVEEVQPGRYVIARELLVDSATVVVVRHRTGSEERIESAQAFAARLHVPDSLRTRVAAAPQPIEARAPDAPGPAWDAPATGLPLGTVLFYTMAMNVWRPEGYAAILADTLRPVPAVVPVVPPRVARAPAPGGRTVVPEGRRTVTPERARTRTETSPRRSGGKGGKGKGHGAKRKGW